jgi:hydrogenase-4 component E
MGPPPGFGAVANDLAHLLGGAMLVLSFGLLYQRRLTALINLYAVQTWVLAAAAGWQGWAQRSPELFVVGLIALSAAGLAVPIALHRIARQPRIRQAVQTAPGIFPGMVMGVVLVALAVLVVLPATTDGPLPTREDLALALSVVLLGQLMMITRRSALAQVVGFLSMENGLLLGAVGVRGMPLVIPSSVAVLALGGALVSGVVVFGVRERFDRPGEAPR